MDQELREQVGAILQTFPPPAQESGAIAHRVATLLTTQSDPALLNPGMNFLLRAARSAALNKKFILQISNPSDPTLELEQLRQRAWKVYALSFIDNSTTTYAVNITNSFNENCWNDDHSDRSDNSTQTSTVLPWLTYPFLVILLLATLVVLVQDYSIKLQRQENPENLQQREVVQ